jgi:hypothetical protein
MKGSAMGQVHEVHTSELKSFRGCRRRWSWIFRENYYPKVTAKPLEFGSAYHAGMEAFYEPMRWEYPHEVKVALAITTFVDLCNEQKAKYVSEEGYLEDEVEEDFNERVELGKGMLQYYGDQVKRTDHRFKPVKVEIPFEVPIINPDTGIQERCYNLHCRQHPGETAPVVFAGRVDMLAEDEHGDYWIFDWKTAARLSSTPDQERTEFLELDDQIAAYVWALKAMLHLPIRGFIYHEQKKGYPLPPARNKQTRLGRMFSVNKQQDTDYQYYLETVSTEDTAAYEAGLYDEMLEWLKVEGPQFFKRYQIHKSEYQNSQTGLNIYKQAHDIVDKDLVLYPNPGRFACGFCAFRQPCLGVNDGSDYKYTLDTLYDQRPFHYWVKEAAPTTEKSGRLVS